MMLMVEAPNELFDEVAVGPHTSHAGETLGAAADLPVGAWLAACLESVDVARLATADLPTYLTSVRRLQNWAASLLDSGIGELATRPEVRDSADAEVALALSEAIGAAQRRIARAKRLRALPLFRRAHRDGDLSERAVDKLLEATNGCDDRDILERVQRDTLGHRFGKTTSQLRRYATRVLDRLDPAAATQRAAAVREEADVVLQPGADGTGLVITQAPVEDAMTIKAYADAYAITAKQGGDPRRIGMLRAEGLRRLCDDALLGRIPGLPAPRSGGRPIEIGIVIGIRTVLGLDDLPGEIPALGIVPRDAIAEMIAKEAPRVRLMVVDDTEPDRDRPMRLVYRGVDSWRPDVEQTALARSQYVTSIGPGCEVRAERCDVEHFEPWPEGKTVATNLGPFDRTWHNRKTRGSLTVARDDDGTITVTTVLGQTRTVTPYDYRGPAAPDVGDADGDSGTVSGTAVAGASLSVTTNRVDDEGTEEPPPF